MKKYCLLFVICVLAAGPALQTQADENFDRLKSAHEKELAELLSQRTMSEEALELRYKSYLESELKKLTATNDDEGREKIENEMVRFKRDKTMSAISPLKYRLESANLSRTKKKIPMLEEYHFELVKLKVPLIRNRQKEDLKLVKDEIERVEQEMKGDRAYLHSVRMAAIYEGLLLHYDFEKSKNNVIRNIVADDKHGVNNGGVLKADARGKGNTAAELGRDSEITTDQFPDSLPALTVALWVKFVDMSENTATDRPQPILVKGVRLGYNWSWAMVYHKDAVLFIIKGNKQVELPVFSEKVKAQTWCHIAATWNGRTSVVYFNGSRGESKAGQNPMVGIKTALKLGCGSAEGNSRPFKGQMDDVMIWDRALSEKEMETLYKDQSR